MDCGERLWLVKEAHTMSAHFTRIISLGILLLGKGTDACGDEQNTPHLAFLHSPIIVGQGCQKAETT